MRELVVRDVLRLLPRSMLSQLNYCGVSPKGKIGSILQLIEKLENDTVPVHSEDPVAEKDARNQAVPIDSRIKLGAKSKSRSRRRRTRGRRSKNKIKGEGRMTQANFCQQTNYKNLYCDLNHINSMLFPVCHVELL